MAIRSAELTPEDPSKVDASRVRQMSIMTMSGLDKKTELAQGRWFADSLGSDDTVEAVMMEEAMYRKRCSYWRCLRISGLQRIEHYAPCQNCGGIQAAQRYRSLLVSGA